MLKFETTPTRRKTVGQLRKGDVIRHNKELYVFDRIPSDSSIYVKKITDNRHFKIRLSTSKDPFDVVGFCEDIYRQLAPNDIDNLEHGDLFLINHNNKGSFVFRFDRLTRGGGTIIAFNPLNNKEVHISRDFPCTKLENAPF